MFPTSNKKDPGSDEKDFKKRKMLDELVDEAVLRDGVNLSNCDREPIHIPNTIQPYGMLIVFTKKTLQILQISQNFEDWTGLSHEAIIKQGFEACLSRPSIQQIIDILSKSQPDKVYQFPLKLSQNNRSFTSSFIGQLHVESNHCCLEIEEIKQEFLSYFNFYDELKIPIDHIRQTHNVQDLCNVAVSIVKKITGYDRVLIYKFFPDQSGCVIAEAAEPDLPSYLDLRYPATDIPIQARILYTMNWLRVIPDVNYEPVPLIDCCPDLPYENLDMTRIGVRSVSPIHLEYLRNMGVQGSFSISIVNNDNLWGLIVCHHQEPKELSLNLRSICEFIGQIISSELALQERNEFLRAQVKRKSVLQSFSNNMLKFDSLSDLFVQKSTELLQMVNATGAVLIEQNSVFLFGQTPNEEESICLYDEIKFLFKAEAIVAISNLSDYFLENHTLLSKTAGLLGLSISEPQQVAIIWFRPEIQETVRWAGKPDKEETIHSNGERHLCPRQSFELWEQAVSGQCSPWTQVDIDTAYQLRNAMVNLFLQKVYDLSSLNLELSRTNDDLSALAYAASHDLKAPLRSISHLTKWIEEDLNEHLTEETRDYIHEIYGNVSRMNDLIHALIDFFQAESQGEALQIVSVSQLIRNVIKQFSTPKSIHFDYPTDELSYKTNPRLLSQVLSNLVDNAIKYIQPSGGQIWINVFPSKKQLTFEIIDNGPGIDPSLHSKIFKMFSTVEDSSSRQSTGMGLAIVKKIVQRQGGTIFLKSSIGGGCNFTFTWPIAEKI